LPCDFINLEPVYCIKSLLISCKIHNLVTSGSGPGGLVGLVKELDCVDVGEVLEVDGLEHSLGVGVDLDAGDVDGRDLRDVVVLALSLLLL